MGPEMSAAHHASAGVSQGPRMVAHCFRGTLADFMAENNLLEGAFDPLTSAQCVGPSEVPLCLY